MTIIRKISSYINFLFRSNIRILFISGSINDNFTKAAICKVTDHNLKDVCAYEGNKYLNKYKKFLDNGDLGYYAYLDGNWVHRTWFKIGPGAINKWSQLPMFQLKPREIYCHFCETAPAACGCNIPAAVLKKAASDLKSKAEHFYTLIDESNYSSRRVMEKAGFKEVKRLRRIGILWFDFYRDKTSNIPE